MKFTSLNRIFDVVRIVINLYFCRKYSTPVFSFAARKYPINSSKYHTIYPMKDFSTGAKFIASLVAMSAVLWFGGAIVRYAIAFDVFLPGTLTLKPFLTPVKDDDHTFFCNHRILYSSVLRGNVDIFDSLTIPARPPEVNGWLFMSFALFYLALPIELIKCGSTCGLFSSRNALIIDAYGDE